MYYDELDDFMLSRNTIFNEIEQLLQPFTPRTLKERLLVPEVKHSERSSRHAMTALPAVDIRKSDEKYTLAIDLPGFEKKDIHLSVRDNILVISAETSSESDNSNGNAAANNDEHRYTPYYTERYVGNYYREIPLGTSIDKEKITASCENGVLTVDLPIVATVSDSKKEIEIQ